MNVGSSKLQPTSFPEMARAAGRAVSETESFA